MFKLVLGVLSVSFFLVGCSFAQHPETEEKTSLAGFAARPAAETAPTLDESSASDKPLQAEESDTLRFLWIPLFPNLPFKVDSVASDGSVHIRVQISEEMARDLARMGMSPTVGATTVSRLTEGYFLGLSGLPVSDRMMAFEGITRGTAAIDNVKAFRAQVIEVQEGGQAVVRVGPAAAEHLKKCDTFLMVRPAGSTTSQLQATPDLVPVIDGITASTGMDSSTAARLSRSVNNLKQIGLAMHNFHDVHKQFPPAVIYGPDGKPWHSWRVLLLPYLDQAALYNQYRFDEPWDGPNNKQLLEKIPSVYRDPIYDETEDAYTHYAVAVGEGTGFSPEGYTRPEDAPASSWLGANRSVGRRRIADFRDGTSNSLLVGSVSPARKIPWMKPEDVAFDEQFPGLGKERGFAAPYKTDKGVGGVFLFADGAVTTIRDDIDLALLRNLVQIADGQVIGDFPRLQPVRRGRTEQALVLEIPRNKPGAVAKLTIEDLRPQESRDSAAPGAPPVPADSEAARKLQSANNLKQLGLAIHNYHDVHRQFPSAYSTDKEGRPLLSWRVYLLPYLEQMALYEQFRLDESWDSEHNKTLIAKMPPLLRSPNSKAEPGKTNYLGVSGPQGIFPGREKISFRDIADGTSNTLMIVEVSDESAVVWTKPDDFVPDSKEPKKGLLGLWTGGFHAGFADGSVRFLDEAIDNEMLQALFTRNGGERIDRTRSGESRTVPRTSMPVEEVSPAPPVPPAVVGPAGGSQADAIADIKRLGGKFLAKGFKSSWSPDGKKTVFGSGTPSTALDDVGGLAILDVETGQVTKLVAPGKDPAWSPGDGKLIAYVTGSSNAERLWVVEAAGGTPRRVADGGFPSWSADGKTLFFHSRVEQKLMAVRIDAEMGEPTELAKVPWWYPAISPDGKQVAFRSGNLLLVADIQSGNVLKRWRFPGSGAGFLGGWSPDGKQIGFGGYGLGDAVGLWSVDSGTGRGRRLAAGWFTMPDWSRDGSKVALDLRTNEGSEIWMLDAAAIEKLPLEELPVNRYALPDGGVGELLTFIQDLREFRPTTAPQYAEHRRAAPAALKAAAEKIFELEKDQWSDAYQTALRVLLEDRTGKIRAANLEEQRQTIEFLKMFLTAKLEKDIEPEDINLAKSAAQALEYANRHELAAAAYGSFAELAAKSHNEEITNTAKMMAGAARRLGLVGNQMELAGTTMDGAQFDWATYRGKVVLVDFWATWCGPCRAELPNVKKNYERYHNRGFDVVGVSLDRDREVLEKFLKDEEIPWVTLYEQDTPGRHPMAEHYGVMGIPTVLLVDKEGIVVSLQARGNELDDLLEKLIGPPTDQ